LKEALLGFDKEIKHLDDHMVYIKKEGITQPGDVIKVTGEGMPIHQSSDKGDLFVRVDIIFPTILTEAQKLGKYN
jgi:DnaJ family protein B protein 11